MSEYEPKAALIADGLMAEVKCAFEYRKVLAKRMEFIELGGLTTRCHTMPINHPQSVAAHSFGVAWWCWLLTGCAPSAMLLLAALAHDLAEHITGDIPSPAKALLGIGDLAQSVELKHMQEAGIAGIVLTPQEEHVLKLADSLELAQHCLREKQMGNHHSRVAAMFYNISSYIVDLSTGAANHCAIARDALSIIDTSWRTTP